MLDIWYTFPAAMGEDQAWITYNHGYAEIAEKDRREHHLRVRTAFKNPTDYGMPTNEEFPALSALDERLDGVVTDLGGVYVGRITVGGYRYFYFYVDVPKEKAVKGIDEVAKSSGYRLQYIYEHDPEKKYYWDELYPTDDDWQVIRDLKVLETLADEGDIRDRAREVTHWAYFDLESNAKHYAAWASTQNYTIVYSGKTEDGEEYMVQFTHVGTMNLGDITHHTIGANRKARELSGRYDGWETSVERD